MEQQTARYPPIGDHAIIGDCRSAALVSRHGSIDWLCWPRFDSPSIFGALLDADTGGHFVICPAGAFRTEQRYLPETNVLETTFHTDGGSVVLRDAMVVMSEERKRETLVADHELVRELEGLEGEVDVRVQYEPRPDYGQHAASLERRGQLGVWCRFGHGALVLGGEMPLDVAADRRSASAGFRLRAGERQVLSLTYGNDGPAMIPAPGSTAHERIGQSARWWRDWSSRCNYEGPWRDAVVRSLLTLKLMCFAPSGAVIAAPTTSLPEVIGGEQNWDYRYCWLRDAAFTVRAFTELGYEEEANAFCAWLLHATRLTQPALQVVYDVYGKTELPQRTLSGLDGYAGTRPVHIGNRAHDQQQLDAYGEVLDAVSWLANDRDFFDSDTVRFLNGLGRTVCERWREPDSGIWESPEARQYTQSKVLCWVALDRLVKLHETFELDVDADRFAAERDAIREAVEQHGYNDQLGSYTQVLDGDELDASLLTLPWYGYIDADHPRMVSTWARIDEQLGRGALMYRHAGKPNDGYPAREGAFGVCCFWVVDYLVRRGDIDAATRRMERLVGYGNETGLFAEEIDPESGAAVGNFPQAFTHVGLITAAMTLHSARSADADRL